MQTLPGCLYARLSHYIVVYTYVNTTWLSICTSITLDSCPHICKHYLVVYMHEDVYHPVFTLEVAHELAEPGVVIHLVKRQTGEAIHHLVEGLRLDGPPFQYRDGLPEIRVQFDPLHPVVVVHEQHTHGLGIISRSVPCK